MGLRQAGNVELHHLKPASVIALNMMPKDGSWSNGEGIPSSGLSELCRRLLVVSEPDINGNHYRLSSSGVKLRQTLDTGIAERPFVLRTV